MLQRARALGDGYLDQARLVASAAWLRVHRGPVVNPVRVNLTLGSRPTRFWVCDLGQLFSLDEVWVAGEYGAIAGGEYDVVLDLGAHVGAASIWLHEQHARAQILAVEPDPVTATLLRRNTEPFERITVVEAAVGDTEGRAQLRSPAFSWGSHLSTVDSECGDGAPTVRTSTVKVTTIPALLREAGLDPRSRVLAKMDIEGSEWRLLQSPRALSQVSEIYGETHSIGAPADPERFLADASRAAGFAELAAPRTFFHWRRRHD